MRRLTYKQAVRFWQRNDEAKKHLDRTNDPEGLCYGLYDDFPPWVNRYYAFFQGLAIDRFLKQIHLSEEDRVLEIGCGSGRWCHRLSRQLERPVAGLDISRHLLRNNQKYYDGKLDFFNGLASAIPLRSSIFGLVFTVTVIQHLPPDFQNKALQEIHRILKPGKTFFMIESTEMDSSSDHLYPRSFDDWWKLLEKHGFQILDAAGQEYIDFRNLIRPVRRKLKSFIAMVSGKEIGNSHPQRQDDVAADAAGYIANILGSRRPEKFFHLLFLPLVLAAYPLELCLFKGNIRDKANYACLMARKR